MARVSAPAHHIWGELHTCPIPPEAPATTVVVSVHLPQEWKDSCKPTGLDHLDCFDGSQSGKMGESGRAQGQLCLFNEVASPSLNRGILNKNGPPYLYMTESSKRTQNKKTRRFDNGSGRSSRSRKRVWGLPRDPRDRSWLARLCLAGSMEGRRGTLRRSLGMRVPRRPPPPSYCRGKHGGRGWGTGEVQDGAIGPSMHVPTVSRMNFIPRAATKLHRMVDLMVVVTLFRSCFAWRARGPGFLGIYLLHPEMVFMCQAPSSATRCRG